MPVILGTSYFNLQIQEITTSTKIGAIKIILKEVFYPVAKISLAEVNSEPDLRRRKINQKLP